MPNLPYISPELLREYQRQINRQASPATAKRRISALKRFFGWAEKEGHIPENPIREIPAVSAPSQEAPVAPKSRFKPSSLLKLGIPVVLIVLLFLLARKVKLPIPFIPAPASETAVVTQTPFPTSVPEIPIDRNTILAEIKQEAIKLVQQTLEWASFEEGNLLIGGAPVSQITLSTGDTTDGDITINPDGSGIAHFLFEGTGQNFLNAQAPNLTNGSLYYGVVANNAVGYDLIRLQSGSNPITRFSVDALGNTDIGGSLNVDGDISTADTERLTAEGGLTNITGYIQGSGNFSITQSAGETATIIKKDSALSDLLTLTLDERGKANSIYSTLTLKRYDGTVEGAALYVDEGNAIFDGQVRLGRFSSSPSSIGTASVFYNTTDNLIYYYDGSAWQSLGTAVTTPFSLISSGTNTTAAMVVGSGASLTFSGTGTITASELSCTGCVANSELANSSITFAGDAGSSATSLGGTRTIAGGEGIDTSEAAGTITIAGEDASTTNKGIASFDTNFFTVTTGAVTVKDDSLDFAQFQDTLDLDADLILNQGAFTWTQNFTGTTTTGLTYNADSLTSGKAISVVSDSTTVSSAFTGDLASLSYSPTYTGGVGLDTTGNLLDISRSIILNNLGNTLTVSGAVATISDSATQTQGTLTHSADVLRIAQNYTSNTGAALNVTSAGGATGFALRVNDDGTFTDTTPFVVTNAGDVGIGTTGPTAKLYISNATAQNSLTINHTETTQYPLLISGNSSKIARFNVGGSTQELDIANVNGSTGLTTTGWLEMRHTLGFNLQSLGSGDATIHNVTFKNGGNVGIGDTTPDAKLEVLATTEQLRLTNVDDTTDARFTVSSTGDLTIDLQGSGATDQLVLGDGDTLNIGSGVASDVAYNLIANAGETPEEAAISSDNDLYIGGDLEVDGTIYGTVSGDLTCTDCLDFTDFEDILDLDTDLILNQGAFTWTQNFTGTTTTGLTYNANSLTSGTGIALASTQGTTTSLFTGDLANLAFTKTYNGGAGSETGNLLDISRSITRDISVAGDLAVTGALSTLSDTAATSGAGTGTLTHSADVLRIAQNYTSNTGSALNVTSAGGATGFALRVNDDGTFTDTTPFVVTNAGDVGIGTTSPTQTFQVQGGALFNKGLATTLSYGGTGSYVFTTTSTAEGVKIINVSGGSTAGQPYTDILPQSIQILDGAGSSLLINHSDNPNAYGITTSAARGLYLKPGGSTAMALLTTGNVGIGDTGPDAKLEVLATTEQLRLTNVDGTTDARFTVSATGDLTIDLLGSGTTDQLVLGDGDTLNIGSGTASDVAYNLIANAGETPEEAAISSDNDLYIGGDLEVDGTIYGNVSGTVTCVDCINASELADIINFDTASETSWTLQANNVTTQSFLTVTTDGLTSGTGTTFDLTATGVTTAFSGDLVKLNQTQTYTGGAGTQSGNVLDIARSITRDITTAGDLAVTGALSTLSDTAATTGAGTGTLTHSADVLRIAQNYTSNTGSALNVTSAGGATGFALRVNDDGTFTDTTPFVVTNAGDIGIGTTSPGVKLEINVGVDGRTKVVGTVSGTGPGYSIDAGASGTADFFVSGGITRLQTSASLLGFSTSSTERMRLDASGLKLGTGYISTTAPANGAIIEGNVGIGDTGPDAKLEVLATTEQLRLTNVDGTTDARFTVSATGDLTIDLLGSGTTDQLVLGDTDTINIGSGTASDVAYNLIANAGETPEEAAISSDNDLYIGGDLEVDGTIYGNVSGTVTCVDCINASELADIINFDTASETSWTLQANNATTQNVFTLTTDGLTSGTGTTFDLTATGVTTAFSGDLVKLNQTQTYTGGVGTQSGNVLDIARSITRDISVAGDLALSGALATISDTAATTGAGTGTLTHSADVLRIAQNYTSNTGSALNVTSAGGATGFALRVNDDGTFTDSTPLVVTNAGDVGIGTTAPGAKLGFAAATTATGGIDFGGDVDLYRSAANRLATNDDFSVNYLYTPGIKSDTVGSIMEFNTTTGNVGIGDVGPDAKLEVLATTEQLRLTNVDGTTDARFTVSATGDLTIDLLGSGTTDQLVLGDGDTLNIGSGTASDVAYNLIANAGETPEEAAIAADNDLYIGGDLEVDGTIYGTVSGDLTCTDCLDFADFEDILDLDTDLILNQAAFTWTQNFTGTTTTGLTYNANSLTSGTGIALASAQGTTTSLFTGDLANLTFTKTYNGGVGSETGNILDVSRSITRDISVAGALTVSGALATLSDTAATTGAGTGTLTHSADVLRIAQNYTSNTGSALNVTSAGGATGFALRINDDGTFTDSTPFVVDNSGNVGIGTTVVNGKLQIAADEDGYGHTNNYSQLEVTGLTDTRKRLSLGYNTTSNFGFIQAITNTVSFDNLSLNALGGYVGIGDTGPDAKLEVLATTEQLRLTNIDDTTDARFTVSATGDLTIDLLGSGTTDQLVLGDTDTINIGSGVASDVAYNLIANAGETPEEAAISSDNDLYIGGDLEVDGTIYGNVSGTVTCVDCINASELADIINFDTASETSWTLQANNATTQNVFTLTTDGLTSGTGTTFDLTATGVTTAFSGDLVKLNQTQTYTGGVGTQTGNVLDIARNITRDITTAGDLALSGALATISDTAATTGAGTGTLTHSADVLRIAQNYTSNTGSALNVTSAGGATGFALRVNDDGTFTDTTPFVVTNAGDVGIGTTGPGAKLDVAGNIRSTTGTLQIGNSSNVAYSRIGTGTATGATIGDGSDLFISDSLQVVGRLYTTTLDGLSTTVTVQNGVWDFGGGSRLGISGTCGSCWPFQITSTVTGSVGAVNIQPTLNTTGAGQTQYGQSINITNSPTDANTLYGLRIAVTDSGSLANTVYGLYVDPSTANANDTTYAAIFMNGNVGIGDTGPDAKLEVLSTTEQLRLTNVDGTTDARFTVSSTGDLTIDMLGSGTTDQLVLGDTDTINIGSGTASDVAYNLIANAGETPEEAAISSDNDLYIGGDLEVDGVIYGTVSGDLTCTDCLDFVDFEDTLDLDTDLILNQGAFTWTQNFTGTTTTGLTYNANSLTSGTGISLASTQGTTTSLFTGDLANLTFTKTYNGGAGSETGNLLDVSRSITRDISVAGDLAVTGALSTLSDTAATSGAGTGTLTHSADVLRIAQNYTSNTGSALNVTSAGGATGFALRINDDGTFTDTTPFVVTNAGDVGIGTTGPAEKLHVNGTARFDGNAFAFGQSTGGTIAGQAMRIIPSLSSASSYAINMSPVLSTGATAGYGLYNIHNIQNYTLATGYGVYLDTPYGNSTGAITTNYGLRVANQNLGSTNAYGIYIDNQTGASTGNFAIYSAGGTNYFGGNVGIGTTGPDRVLDSLAASAPQLRLTQADGTVYADFQVDASGNLTVTTTGTTVTFSGDTVSATDFSCTNCLDFTEFENTLDLDAALTLNQTTNTWTQSFTGTTTTGFAYTANSLTTGSALNVTSSSNPAAAGPVSPIQFNLTNANATTATTINGIDIGFTNNPTVAGNTEYVLQIQNEATANLTDNAVAALLRLDNADTLTSGSTVITDAILISVSGGLASGIVDAIDASDANIDNALNVGANNLIGTTGNIDLTNFDVVGSTGNITTAGDIAVNGGDITTSAAIFNLVNTTATTVNFAGAATTNMNAVTLSGHLTLSGDANEGASGGGLVDCDTATTSKLLWDATTNKFSCGTDQGGSGSPTKWSDLTAPTAPLSLSHAEYTTAFTWDTATDAAKDYFTLALTNDLVTDTTAQRLLVLQNNNSTGSTATENLLVLNNADLDEAVTTGIQILSEAGTITTAIDVSDAEIGTALAFGANDIDGTNFDVTGATGNITVAVGAGLDTNAAGILALGNTTATTVNLGTTAATAINIGATGSLTRTIAIGTGTGADTINIGTGATTADDINLGGLATTTVDVVGTIRAGDGGATNYLQTTSGGNLSFVGSASTIDKVSGTLNINTTNNQAITTGTGLLTSGGNLTFSGTTARTITGPSTGGLTMTVASGPLALSTTTSGNLTLTSAAALNLSATSASTWTLPAVANALNIDSNTLTIDALNNRVGIGTTGPGEKFSVVSADDIGTTNIARFYANNLSQSVGIGFQDVRQVAAATQINLNAGTTGVIYLGNTSTGGTNISLAGGNTVLNATAGNVGIGTTGPQEKLTLASASNLATEMALPTGVGAVCSDTGGSLAAGTYYFKATASHDSSATSSTTGSAEANCTVTVGTTGSATVSWTAPTGASGFRVYKGTSSGGQDRYFTDTASPYVYTTDTGATLGSVPTVTTAYVNKFTASGNSWLLGGNVGIGTTAPTQLLDIVRSGNGANLRLGATDGSQFWLFGSEGGVGASSIGAGANDVLLVNRGTGGMALGWGVAWADIASAGNINLKGNVGIGDTTPAAALTVGSGDLFQVNSSGIIAAIDGVAHTIDDVSGNLTLTSNGTSVMVADDLGVNGATSADITSTTTTASLFDSTVTTLNIGGAVTALNLGDAATTKTIDIGGVTASGTDTINIATNATAADTINIGNTHASTATTISGGVINLTTDSTGNAEVVLPNDSIGPNEIFTSGQTDEYCLTYEATGATWEWQICGGSSSWSALTDPAGPLTLSMAANTTTMNWTVTGASDPWTMNLTNNATTATAQRFVNIVQAVSTGTDATDALLRLDNADTSISGSTIVTDAILVTNTGGITSGIVDAIDASATEIDNALNAGTNFVLFSTLRAFEGTSGTLTIEDTGGDDMIRIIDQGTTGNVAISGSLQVGSLATTVAYSRFGATAATIGAITTTNDVLIGGDLEMVGGLYLVGKNLYNPQGTNFLTICVAGGVNCATPSEIEHTLTNGSWTIQNPSGGNVGKAALIVAQTLGGDIFTASSGATPTTKFTIANNGNVTISGSGTMLTVGGGTGKIDVGTVDPVYAIAGKKFATYMAGMIGVKEETTGNITTSQYIPGIGYRTVVDFKEHPEGSDLWLFSRTTDIKNNIDKLVVLLSPSDNTRAWYEVDKANYTVSIYSARPTTISYRFTAPRFDYADWSNYNDNPEATGFAVDDSPLVGSSETQAQTTLALTDFEIVREVPETAYKVYQTISEGSKIVVEEFGAFANLVVGNVKAGAIESKDIATETFISFQGTIDNMLITSGLVSPVIQTETISPLADKSDVKVKIGNEDVDSGFGRLIVENTQGEEVAAIDTEGNATFSGTLEADEVKTNEVIAGKIYADEIVARNGYFGQTNTSGLSGITREEIEALLNSVESDQQLLAQASTWDINSATDSANLNELAVSNLYVTQQAAVNSLSVSTSLALGSDFVIQTSLNDQGTIVNSIDTLSSPLSIQSLALAPVEIMAGKVRVETNGDVTIAGNLYVAGQIESSGLTLKENGFGELLKLQDAGGNQIAVISASGSAEFATVSTDKLIIAGGDTAPKIADINQEIQTNATAGSAVISAGITEITIRNPNISDYTLVYVTPTSSTQNNVLYVKSKGQGFFRVGFSKPLGQDVTFNWWVIDIHE